MLHLLINYVYRLTTTKATMGRVITVGQADNSGHLELFG